MSSFLRKTQHPQTGEWETAAWLDDHFGRHKYGVKFLDGQIFSPAECDLPTTEDNVDHDWNAFFPQQESDHIDEALPSKDGQGVSEAPLPSSPLRQRIEELVGACTTCGRHANYDAGEGGTCSNPWHFRTTNVEALVTEYAREQVAKELVDIRATYDRMEQQDFGNDHPEAFIGWRAWKGIRNVITDRLEAITGSRTPELESSVEGGVSNSFRCAEDGEYFAFGASKTCPYCNKQGKAKPKSKSGDTL